MRLIFYGPCDGSRFGNVAFLVVADLISERAFDFQFFSRVFLRRDDLPFEDKLTFVHRNRFLYRFQEKISRLRIADRDLFEGWARRELPVNRDVALDAWSIYMTLWRELDLEAHFKPLSPVNQRVADRLGDGDAFPGDVFDIRPTSY